MAWAQFVILVVVFVVVAISTGLLARRRSEAGGKELRQELQALLAAQAQSVAAQIGQLAHSMTQQLGQVSQQLQSGVAATGALASEAQKEVSAQIRASTEVLGVLRQQLGAVQQAGRELSEAAKAIETVLGGTKTRGTLGEVALERMLEDALPRSAYDTQYRFPSGAIVDAALHVGGKLIPVDSKFPLDAYRRLQEAGDNVKDSARKEFARAVRTHADSIAEKYILPAEGTLDYALMFIPSEGVYYEFLLAEDARVGLLADYCRSRRVVAVSPNVLYAYLHTILMGLRGMQIEENARRLLEHLGGLRKQFENFAGTYEKLGTHLRNAQQNYEEANSKLEKARNSLEQMAAGTIPQEAASALEPAAKD
jgi:DNA recombination protein RmuC